MNNSFDWSSFFQTRKVKGSQTQGHVKLDPNEKTRNFQSFLRKPSHASSTEYAAAIRKEEEQKDWMRNLVKEANEVDPLKMVDDLSSMGTMPNVADLNLEENAVYDNYNFENKKPQQLSVFEHKDVILNMIYSYQVCVIKGNTGCGKTTQIPQMILDFYFENRKHCNIVVTQPRRIAAKSVAQRVSDERDWKLGTIVGYQVGLEKKVSKDTRLTYCTTGVLLQKFISEKHMNDFTHIILDEVHERDQDMDFLMLVVKKFQRTVSSRVKIILMSATINTSPFTEYFTSYTNEEAPVLEVGHKTNFPVSIYYLDKLKDKLGDFPEIEEHNPRIDDRAYMYVVTIIQAFDCIDEIEYKNNPDYNKGSVLVFLPGLHEIEMLYEALKDTEENSGKKMWWICPLHSSITTDEQMKVFKSPQQNLRKIILSTNIAESSITVPDIKYVIDFCLTKILYADPNTNLSSLHMTWASRDKCDQRAGRVGRVMAGRVYRLVYERFYYEYLPDEGEPEILRSPLETVVLKTKLLEMGEPKAVLALAMNPPDLNRLEQTVLILKETGALLMTVNGVYHPLDGDITCLGRVMAALPLDIKVTKLIMLGHAFGILDSAIIMGCAMTVKNMFSKPFKKDLQAYISKLTWADSSCSDPIACWNAYKVWRLEKTSGKFDRPGGNGAKSWGKRYFIQINSMYEVARLQEEVKRRLFFEFGIEESKSQSRVTWTPFQESLMMKIILAGAFYPHYFLYSNALGQTIDESGAVKVLGGRDPYNSVYLSNFPINQPGRLYANAIKNHFSECGVNASAIQVSFDKSSKVYVEFKGVDRSNQVEDNRKLSSTIPGKISMAVYRALKMRQHNSSTITVMVLPHEEAHKKIEAIEKERAQLNKKPVDKTSILPSLTTNYIEIRVSYVNDPGDFWVQYKDAFYYSKLVNIENYLNLPLYQNQANLRPVNGAPELDKLYAVPYDCNGEKKYYRAKLIEVKYQQNIGKILFVDYGNIEYIRLDSLRKFSPIQKIRIGSEVNEVNIENEPYLAFNCTLAHVQPSLTKDRRSQWSKEAKKEFEKFCCGVKGLIAKVYSVVNNVAVLELYIRDPNKKGRSLDEDVRTMLTINKYLLEKDLAQLNEESYLSKMDHDLRLSEENSEFPATGESGLGNLLSNSNVNEFDIPESALRNCRYPVRLKGPFNPLEMKVYGCTQSNCSKNVHVEQDSVNSVLLDTNPHDPHQRILVASTVGQSPDGSKLTLRYTTKLPNIHGLPALISLIFCPNAELRANESFTRLTGVVCGLGYDSETSQPYFPENDIEITFDTLFTLDDIVTINKLRYWLSVFMSSSSSHNPFDFTSAEIIEKQNKVKKHILELLERLAAQKPERVVNNIDSFRWGLLDEEEKLDPGAADTSWAVYPLIYGINLNDEEDELIGNPRLKKNLEKLKDIASGCAFIKGSSCELCHCYFDNFLSLKLHLESLYHLDLVKIYKLE